MSQTVLLDISDRIATVTLNRPDKMNALNADMWRELHRIVAVLELNDTVRCIILRGAGAHFAAGADLAEFRDLRWSTDQAVAYGRMMVDALHGLRDCRHPTIAAIEGNCIGAGLEIAAMCDLRLATTSAKFGVPIQKIGVTMPYPEIADLVDLLGRPTVLEMLLEGGIYDANWALAKGLVTRLCAGSSLLDEAGKLADRVASGSPVSHARHKAMTRRCLAPIPISAEEMREAYAACEAADYREGISAFLEKRRPNFPGR
ncbi:enoyl-CoA hydratase/isomerase family protein [Dongia soli]|uniref:Enoyl-CoA hydratase-related protein n=1 Tax=Dongia soli TaxID=600628 RepID=A0ABU5EDD5_9PROT|nr:enoyl-CoA hydratase-related protein [Dongia soli]MDY0884201.1 enoyl-CoA hydratase-related protein [Dongia soli]